MKKVIMGNHAVSYAVMLSRAQVISAYPITPQTQIVEELSEFCADGRLDAKFIKVESEHSAMACCIGAATAGVRTFTATSAQGLALMHELLHWASGARLPIVLANVNRAMAPGWSIWSDQTDSLSQRDTGWIQFYCGSNQEILDSIIEAYRIAEKVLLPVMVIYDAFFLSHTYEAVDIPEQEIVDKFLPPYAPKFCIDLEDPRAFYGLVEPEHYMELRYKIQEAMEMAKVVIPEVDIEFERHFGRRYNMINQFMTEGEEVCLVTSGSITGTAFDTVNDMREKGIPVALVSIRVFRPFLSEELRVVLKRFRKIGIIDRNISFGCGGIFAQEVRSSLYGEEHKPLIVSYIAGLGGRDVTPKEIEEIVTDLMSRQEPVKEPIWIGLKR